MVLLVLVAESTADYNIKQPIIIPYTSHLASISIHDIYLQFHHGGFTLVNSQVKGLECEGASRSN